MRSTATAVVATLISCCAFGQSGPAPSAVQAADVHVSDGTTIPIVRMAPGGRVELRSLTMLRLISVAWNLDPARILGGPAWLNSDRYDLVTQSPAGSTDPQVRDMIKALLAERFHLKAHIEPQPFPAYVMLPAAAGLQLTRSSPGTESNCKSGVNGGVATYTCQSTTMTQLAQNLRSVAPLYFDNPIVDHTGAEGAYDFTLKWTRRGGTSGNEGTVSPFDDMEKHLGIKVEPQKVPFPVVHVDSVDRVPVENPAGVNKSLIPMPSEFEAAEIRPGKPDGQKAELAFTHGRLTISGMSLKYLIEVAYSMDSDRVLGGDKWIGTAPFDVVAKTDAVLSLDAIKTLLRKLLADQFRLTTHQEERSLPVYALLAPNTATKLTEGDTAASGSCRQVGTNGARTYRCENISMAEFAEDLKSAAPAYINHPVVDLTELKSRYTFSLRWSPAGQTVASAQPRNDDNVPNSGVPAGADRLASDPSGATSLFDAIEKQLGLRLVPQKLPMPVIIVDSAQRPQ